MQIVNDRRALHRIPEPACRLSRLEKLSHNVLTVFQPAEETIGGAKDLCGTGIFYIYNVETIFGLHLWTGWSIFLMNR